MMISVQNRFGRRWISITPNSNLYHVNHMYMDHIWEFETLGL